MVERSMVRQKEMGHWEETGCNMGRGRKSVEYGKNL
jgi:hypothetical protein